MEETYERGPCKSLKNDINMKGGDIEISRIMERYGKDEPNYNVWYCSLIKVRLKELFCNQVWR